MNTELRINLKFFVRLSKHPFNHFLCFSTCMDITSYCTHVFLRGTKGSKRVKDVFRDERPSTITIEDNFDPVKQIACRDHRVTVRMIASQHDMKKSVFGRLSSKIWACTRAVSGNFRRLRGRS